MPVVEGGVTSRGQQIRWIASIALVAFGLDQITKAIVRATIELGAGYRTDVFLQFVHHENTGIVGGAFRDIPIVGYVAPMFAFVLMIFLFRHLRQDSRVQWIGYALVLGGAVGNIADRIVFGAVTDFIQVHFHFVPFDFPWKFFPTFNVADACIDIGVVMLLLTFGWREERDVARTA